MILTTLRRAAWRAGRRIYMAARGEQSSGAIDENGESFVQRCVVEATASVERLVALDIGANVGEWTSSLLNALPASRRSPERLRIDAFEPVHATAGLLRQSIASLHGRECLQVHECAMSDARGTAKMAVYAEGAGTNTMHHDAEQGDPRTIVEVPLTTLADFCRGEGLDHIHLGKCDTEGNDARVLAGAAALLREGRIDVLQFEYNYRWIIARSFLKDVFDLVQALPYAVARVDKAQLTIFDHWHPELERFFQSNYVLVHERAVSWFPVNKGRFDEANTYA